MQELLTHSSSHSSSSLPESLISSLSPSRSLLMSLSTRSWIGAVLGLGSQVGLCFGMGVVSATGPEVKGSLIVVGMGWKLNIVVVWEMGAWSEVAIGASSGRGLGVIFEVCSTVCCSITAGGNVDESRCLFAFSDSEHSRLSSSETGHSSEASTL